MCMCGRVWRCVWGVGSRRGQELRLDTVSTTKHGLAQEAILPVGEVCKLVYSKMLSVG